MRDEATSVHLFSNAFEWDNWQARNCQRCVKEPTCDLIDAMFTESLTNDIPHGSVLPETASRLGYTNEYIGVLGWPCKERQADAAPPPPAATEMVKAGAQQLPGFENVAERPADGRKSWTA